MIFFNIFFFLILSDIIALIPSKSVKSIYSTSCFRWIISYDLSHVHVVGEVEDAWCYSNECFRKTHEICELVPLNYIQMEWKWNYTSHFTISNNLISIKKKKEQFAASILSLEKDV